MSLTKEELRAKTREIVDLEDKNILTASADLICFYLENCEITVPEENRFFVNVNCLIFANEAGGRRFRRFNIEPACGEEVLANIACQFRVEVCTGANDDTETEFLLFCFHCSKILCVFMNFG